MVGGRTRLRRVHHRGTFDAELRGGEQVVDPGGGIAAGEGLAPAFPRRARPPGRASRPARRAGNGPAAPACTPSPPATPPSLRRDPPSWTITGSGSCSAPASAARPAPSRNPQTL